MIMRAAGLAIAFCGSSLQSLGILLQKKAQNQLNGEDDTVSRDFIIRDEDIEKDEDTEGECIDYLQSKLWRYEFWYNFNV